MTFLAVPVLLAALQAASTPPPPPPAAEKILAVRTLFAAPGGALLWLSRTEDGPPVLRSVEPWFEAISVESFPEPVGDGVWAELLSARLQLLGTFRAAPPPPGGSCALELPVVHGTWYVLLVERRGDATTVLARLEVGPRLAELVNKYPIPVL